MKQALADPAWSKYIDDGFKAVNKKAVSNASVVQKWRILPVDVSMNGGELTPTLKLKRNVINDKYAALIESMYDEDAAPAATKTTGTRS